MYVCTLWLFISPSTPLCCYFSMFFQCDLPWKPSPYQIPLPEEISPTPETSSSPQNTLPNLTPENIDSAMSNTEKNNRVLELGLCQDGVTALDSSKPVNKYSLQWGDTQTYHSGRTFVSLFSKSENQHITKSTMAPGKNNFHGAGQEASIPMCTPWDESGNFPSLSWIDIWPRVPLKGQIPSLGIVF